RRAPRGLRRQARDPAHPGLGRFASHRPSALPARRELIIVLTVEDAHADDGADLTVGNTQRGVADLARLLTEDRTQQPLLRGQLGLTLRGDLADEDVSVSDLGADA